MASEQHRFHLRGNRFALTQCAGVVLAKRFSEVLSHALPYEFSAQAFGVAGWSQMTVSEKIFEENGLSEKFNLGIAGSSGPGPAGSRGRLRQAPRS